MDSGCKEQWRVQWKRQNSDSVVAIDGALWERVVFLFASVSIRHNGMFRLDL